MEMMKARKIFSKERKNNKLIMMDQSARKHKEINGKKTKKLKIIKSKFQLINNRPSKT